MDEKKVTRNSLIPCIGMAIALLLFVVGRFELLLGPDDVGMRNIISGIYTGKPDAYAYFIYYLLAKMLSLLYLCAPNGYWYVCFLIVVNYSSLVLIMYRTTHDLKSHRNLVLIIEVFIFVILWIQNLITLEWSVSAGIMSATAIFWYLTIPEQVEKKHIIGEYLIPLILLVLAYNLRHSVVEMAMPYAGIAFCIRIYKGRLNKKQSWKKEFIFLLVCVLAVGTSYLTNHLAYSSEAWKEADKFSEYRSNMFDRFGYLDYDTYKELYQKNKISREMYESIRYDYNFMMAGKGVLTSENLKELSEQTEASFYEKQSFLERVQDCFAKRWESARSDTYRIYSVFFYTGILAGVISAWKRKDKIKMLLLAGTVFIFEFMWIYLYYRNRLPSHVGYSLNIVAIAVATALLWDEQYVQQILKKKAVFLLLLFGISVVLGSRLSLMQSVNEKEVKNAAVLQEVKQYCEEKEENIYFRHFYSFNNSILYKELIESGEERSAANFIPPNGWSVILPMDNQYVPTGGRQELCSWISEKDNIYFMAEKGRAENACARTERLFASRGIACELVLEDELNIANGQTIQVYHFVCR